MAAVMDADTLQSVPKTTALPQMEAHEEMVMHVYGILNGAMTANMIELGERLDLYKGLAEAGPCSPDALAQRLKLNARYVAEWCRQQAASRLICCDAQAETFWMSKVQQDVMVKEHGPDASPYFAIGGFSALSGFNEIAAKRLPEAYRTGEGLPYDTFGDSVACGVCRELGTWLRHCLVDRLCSVPGVKAKLEAGCAVADVGCGCGEAVITAAAAFPNSTFRGFDISEKALARARAAAAARGLANAEFVNPGLEEGGMGEGVYDLVMTHDAIHDMSRPRPVIANVHKAMKPGALWVLGDMSALESHGANISHHPMASLCYGFSCHICLPSAMEGDKPEALGTMGLSQAVAESMLKEGGFQKVEVVDWGHPLNRYYLVTAATPKL